MYYEYALQPDGTHIRMEKLLLILFFQFFHFRKPHISGCITWHAPVAAWGEVDGSNFDTIRHAVAFELLREEAGIEGA